MTKKATPEKTKHRWSPDEDGHLGTHFDHVVAIRLGLSEAAVAERRKHLGVREYTLGLSATKWKALFGQLGRNTDKGVATKFGLKPGQVTLARKVFGIRRFRGGRLPWSPRHIAMLGKVHDAVLAAALGVTPAAVVSMRHKYKKPAYKGDDDV